jgi:uncharacterized protein
MDTGKVYSASCWRSYLVPRIEEYRRQADHKVTPDEIRAAVEELARRFPEVQAVWLFGSYGRGEERRTSDVDVAVMTTPELSREFGLKGDLQCALEDLLRVPVDVVLLHSELPLPLLWEILAKPVLMFSRNSADAHAFASGLRGLVRDEWPRVERAWARTRAWAAELERATRNR